jgi:hypothetical protein
LRIRLLAAILILEQGADEVTEPAVFNELRASLGLPASEEITADGQPVQNIPMVRVPRLRLDQVADDDLVMLYRRAVLVAADAALLHVGAEAVRRPSLAERIPPRDAYRRMIAAESDPDRALALISAARQATAAAGKTNVTWDLAELEEHISAGNVDQAQSMLQFVLREYADRQDTAEELVLTLRRMGLLRESDFSPDDEEDEFEPAPAMAASPEQTTGRIWTPDSERPAGGKSPLWTPS